MDLAQRVSDVQRRMAEACQRAGRAQDSVQLAAVSKGHPPEAIREAVQAGLRLFAENKIQEAKLKIPQCPPSTQWHFIGHLQSNKVRDAVAFFHTIQSVDRWEIAEALNQAAEKAAKSVRIYLEVNVAGESTKFGFSPEALLRDLERMNSLPRLEIYGLMGMAPWTPDQQRIRQVFRRLRELRDECCSRLGAPSMELSMGMSGDYEIAIEEGATLVRVGTALFGPRRFVKAQASE